MFNRLFSGIKSFVMSSTIKPDVVFVLGAPGAGKGTQCENIVKQFGFVHLSAGDLLREERNKEGSEYGELIEETIRNGRIVPVEITCSLIEMAMKKSGSNKFLIDGFPRNKDNLDGWNRQMASNVNLLFVLFFDCPQEVCVNRCLQRGAGGSGRSDDNPESLKKRFHTYMNDTMPIIRYYEEKNLVKHVDAGGTPDEIFEAVKAIYQNMPPCN
ncbi:UMP-CMP kinase [Cryptotermes secundus]|uniref:UMP-CMP kinase n=1 Tax=Cryptotermes secundus TaxID=105785 RepID=UPI000CD7C551|nr:UMP-CMP kinase [Cryptotermes secundus]XP_023722842.1 UMP-CMP kinase [Cryptotermes secundus]XP_023722843.1 UMP-CMP kinase [Cryptotermes secundus]XP_023722844.1 UMP-CMP kinase [Cryptotermes secundus]XP_023722845.1 UMP-CMP kinase [Cryptotermes secundus]XP_023722846.1 UMP-CMP kinase [Cryptotermes secundus]XP_023722848.1 UMP-CMP kinase [Cryptotermes secundus]